MPLRQEVPERFQKPSSTGESKVFFSEAEVSSAVNRAFGCCYLPALHNYDREFPPNFALKTQLLNPAFQFSLGGSYWIVSSTMAADFSMANRKNFNTFLICQARARPPFSRLCCK
jgi:hypothetical protein